MIFNYKDKCRAKLIEYELRTIDQFGDVIDIDRFESKEAAIASGRSVLARGEIAAIVVEKHTSCRPSHMFNDPDKYEKVFSAGTEQALSDGGWL